MELNRHDVQDLASAIAATESLIDFKESSNTQNKKISGSAKGRGD